MPDLSRHMMAFSPLIPMWAIYLLLAAAIVLTVSGLLRRVRGSLWRLLALVAVIAWLCNPQRITETWRPLPETALVVVDQSASMSERNRADMARNAAEQAQAEMNRVPGLVPRIVTLRETRHGGTRLFETLQQAAADIPPSRLAGAVLITDGEDHDVPASVPDMLNPDDGHGHRTALPLHVLLTGRGEETDRHLRVLQAPPFAIVGKDVTIRVEVDDQGAHPAPDATTQLTLTLGDGASFTRPVRIGQPQDITLPVTHPGEMLVGLSAPELPGEVSTRNNHDVIRINGVRDRLRVLLVSGTPNQGERVWRRLLKADPSVDLVHFTILRPPDRDDGTPLSDLALIAFPVNELFQQKIGQFDLIILDGFENRGILPESYLRNIVNHIRAGGGLLLIGGPEFLTPGSLQDTALSNILPAHVSTGDGMAVQRFRPDLTDTGQRHPVTSGLPGAPEHAGATPGWGPWYRSLRTDASRGEVLMTGPDRQPLLVLDHAGKGRVAFLLSDQAWLWSHGEGGGGPQSELLRRISHWLMKEPELEENQLEATITAGQMTITRRAITAGPPPVVHVIAPDGAIQSVTLEPADNTGLSRARLPARQDGIWTVRDDEGHEAFAAPRAEDPVESADLRATASILTPIVAATGGGIHWLGDDPRHPSLPQFVMENGRHGSSTGQFAFPARGAHSVSGQQARTLLPAWAVGVFVILMLLVAWWRESRA
ncbi:VWA domain-containing protein [Komagataeibacter melaceti]|nr:VWA domain-containing protein [Komagataeibacter melaceti]